MSHSTAYQLIFDYLDPTEGKSQDFENDCIDGGYSNVPVENERTL